MIAILTVEWPGGVLVLIELANRYLQGLLLRDGNHGNASGTSDHVAFEGEAIY